MSSKVFLPLFVLCLSLAGCKEPPEHKEIIRTVIAFEPTSSSTDVVRTISGVLQPVDQSVLSFEIPGVVQSVNVNLGDQFKQGDVLASIDDKVFQLAVQQRQGQLSEAQARLTEAKLDFERKAQLISSGAVSQAEVDVAKSRYQSLFDQVAIAKTQLEIAEEDLSDTRLTAPYAGSVALRHVEPSQQIAPSSAVLTIQGSDALEVSVLIPERIIGRINRGDGVNVDITVNQRKQSFSGVVFEKGKQAQRANAFPVTIALNQQANMDGLQPGMSAEVEFTVSDQSLPGDALQAPLSAIAAEANNAHFVYEIRDQEGVKILKKVPVKLLSMNANQAIFSSDQPVGKIVRVGMEFLSDGQQVFVRDDYPNTLNQ